MDVPHPEMPPRPQARAIADRAETLRRRGAALRETSEFLLGNSQLLRLRAERLHDRGHPADA
jgi:hypothetical protein